MLAAVVNLALIVVLQAGATDTGAPWWSSLVAAGPLGVIIIGLALYVRQLSGELKDVQDKRTKDAQDVVERIVAIVEARNTIDQQTNTALTQLQATLAEVKEAIRDQARHSRGGGQ